ncbi:hypothetical protein KOI35_42770 [Actinoplanes bogorensis]|uniref:Nucleoside phosphorylase domain-containing protein n=1 Tax=Paractinoplanes bogorensis TaxID=1610840 RepID=A0ABS5Z3X8_9ACTN|nr:hypothetical protein [Actinoplanes bogorensis]MBU2670246.1 hypothetical protein [Actinoplanes bogorensis]
MADIAVVLDLYTEEPVLGDLRPLHETAIEFGRPVLVPAQLSELDPVHRRRTDLDRVRLYRLRFPFDLRPPRRNRRFDAVTIEFAFADQRVIALGTELSTPAGGETSNLRGIGRSTVELDLEPAVADTGLRPRHRALDILVEAPAEVAKIHIGLRAELTVARILGAFSVRRAASRHPQQLVLSTGPAEQEWNEALKSVDVLVIAALPMEYDAARSAGNGVEPGGWRAQAVDDQTPYETGEIHTPDGGRLTVALARPVEMGGRRTGTFVTRLTEHLRPTCLAMSGVCAGNPADTAPGDVVIATPVYQYDEGKQSGSSFFGAHQQYTLSDPWVRTAQGFQPAGLPSHGDATPDEATIWVLERLYQGQDPIKHPARDRYFPRGTWRERSVRIESDGLIAWTDDGWTLTTAGTAKIRRTLADDVDGPDRLPFAVLTGPMASGNAVVQDHTVWDRLKGMGARKILALEMEAATLATVAAGSSVPHWLVAKGVMDHADFAKDDRFKRFAAIASAEVLFALLTQLIRPRAGQPALGVQAAAEVQPAITEKPASAAEPAPASKRPGEIKLEFVRRLGSDWRDLADYVDVPSYKQAQFTPGDEPRALWEWLESRQRLAELPAALVKIGRPDLADLLRS